MSFIKKEMLLLTAALSLNGIIDVLKIIDKNYKTVNGSIVQVIS